MNHFDPQSFIMGFLLGALALSLIGIYYSNTEIR